MTDGLTAGIGLQRHASAEDTAGIGAALAAGGQADMARRAMSPRLRMLHRYTFHPNGWHVSVRRSGSGLWGTQFLTLGCPDDFHAVRIGFPNINAHAYAIPACQVCPSGTWNDYANPTGGAKPVALTFAQAGADRDAIVTMPDAPRRIVVHPSTPAPGEAGAARWTWTDWVAVSNLDPDPSTGMRVLMVRHTVADNHGNPVTCNNGTLAEWSGRPAINRGYDYFCGGLNNGTDCTDFRAVNPASLPPNLLVNGAFATCVQFLTRHRGLVGMTTGDSHHEGTSTTGSFNNYLAQAVTALGQQTVGRLPMGWANTAIGGTQSGQFFPYLLSLLPHVKPSFVVLPGWTANEVHHGAMADQACADIFFARLLQAADAVRLNGALPIWLTPFPRNSSFMTPTRLAAWHGLRQRILDQASQDEVVIDAAAALGCRLDGLYSAGMSGDDVHPNDAGHSAVAALLIPALQHLLGDASGW